MSSPPPAVTSESGLSESSSSPEGDAFLVGFERNQLNQPNPELCKGKNAHCCRFPAPWWPCRGSQHPAPPSTQDARSAPQCTQDPKEGAETEPVLHLAVLFPIGRLSFACCIWGRFSICLVGGLLLSLLVQPGGGLRGTPRPGSQRHLQQEEMHAHAPVEQLASHCGLPP